MIYVEHPTEKIPVKKLSALKRKASLYNDVFKELIELEKWITKPIKTEAEAKISGDFKEGFDFGHAICRQKIQYIIGYYK